MVDFVNPGLLKDYATFRKVFEEPILASRQANCKPDEIAIGSARSAELARLTKEFILRRTSDVNNAFLPPKSTWWRTSRSFGVFLHRISWSPIFGHFFELPKNFNLTNFTQLAEFVLFCKPSDTQVAVYNAIVSSKALRTWLTSSGSAAPGQQPPHLYAILLLRQLCNAAAATLKTLDQVRGRAGSCLPQHSALTNSVWVGTDPSTKQSGATADDDAGEVVEGNDAFRQHVLGCIPGAVREAAPAGGAAAIEDGRRCACVLFCMMLCVSDGRRAPQDLLRRRLRQSGLRAADASCVCTPLRRAYRGRVQLFRDPRPAGEGLFG